jgi:hypothetical protein
MIEKSHRAHRKLPDAEAVELASLAAEDNLGLYKLGVLIHNHQPSSLVLASRMRQRMDLNQSPPIAESLPQPEADTPAIP